MPEAEGYRPQPERNLPALSQSEKETGRLRETIDNIRPFLEADLLGRQEGVQYNIQTRQTTVRNPEEFREIAGEDIPQKFMHLFGSGEVKTSRWMGVLNYIPEGANRQLEFRSRSDGTNFQVNIDESGDVSIEGETTPEEVRTAIEAVFRNGEPITDNNLTDKDSFRITATKNLHFFERDGLEKART